VAVAGDSMRPSFQPGDRLLVLAAFKVRVGDVVAVEDPRDAGRLMIKRVRSVSTGGVDVRGDNPAASTDTRHFGLVPVSAVHGRVVYRYAPAGRIGWHPGRSA
jgi:nickel-type superoxide dismutase maturation protease